jgi:cytosolic phospholipase A2
LKLATDCSDCSRHERPWKDWADEKHPFIQKDPTDKEHQEAANAWFQWYEMTPYEVGCDEIEAWCPTWGFGRQFEGGKSTKGLPEQSLALILGLCTSAPAGPLSSYLSTIQRNLPAGFIGNAINQIASGVAKMWGKHETEVFENHHPLHASLEYNFLYHYTSVASDADVPPGLEHSPDIQLIDSGM